MNQVIQIEWSAPNQEEARKICKALVEKKLVACAQMIPHMESIYLWKGKIESSLETKVYLKTVESRLEEVEAFILENSSYELPEILKIEVTGLIGYLNWIKESVLF